MKEASGELNMTVITIVAIAAVGALFYVFVWPTIQASIVSQSCKQFGPEWHAVKKDNKTVIDGSQAKVYDWYCCPKNETSVTSACVGKEN